jgi:catechol 2,3-dioxygenase-like lactoylglutathione lyase family enzyme
MPLNALHHVTVKTTDLEATRDFYRNRQGSDTAKITSPGRRSTSCSFPTTTMSWSS